ncbi:MAG: SAM-dependent methyltransferase [Halioglobus sp.]|nr:SAM-dependent methyltransferase [Halioglobus sp.]
MQTQCNDIFAQLETWYGGDSGRYLQESILCAARPMLETAFGYHILQLGVQGDTPLCAASPINHRIGCAAGHRAQVGLVAEAFELPLESDSVDVVIAHHCLDFTDHPHQVLREIQRVLTPQGQLLLIGFNPLSLHGLHSRLRGWLRDPLWRRHRPVGEHRVTDWLHLLGCEVQDVARLYAVPPAGRGRLRAWLARLDRWGGRHNVPLSGLYVLHAVKQVAGLHRPRRALRGRSARLIGLVPKPAPSPTPAAPHACDVFEKGDVAA